MNVHPAPVIEICLIAASGLSFLYDGLTDSAHARAVGIEFLGAALIFALGVVLVYGRSPISRH
jgi:hypothetical protein